MNICESLNLAVNTKAAPSRAITFDPRIDINIYDTLWKYLADNDIKSGPQDDENDFLNAVDIISDFVKNARKTYNNFDQVSFWID